LLCGAVYNPEPIVCYFVLFIAHWRAASVPKFEKFVDWALTLRGAGTLARVSILGGGA
jgi:hypothetical protein